MTLELTILDAESLDTAGVPGAGGAAVDPGAAIIAVAAEHRYRADSAHAVGGAAQAGGAAGHAGRAVALVDALVNAGTIQAADCVCRSVLAGAAAEADPAGSLARARARAHGALGTVAVDRTLTEWANGVGIAGVGRGAVW